MAEDTVYLEAKCAHTKAVFYIKYYKGADGVWVLMEGCKYLPQGEKTGNSAININVSESRTSPRYACPYCGNKSYVQCGCGKLTCYSDQSELAYCAYCKTKSKINGSIENVTGSGGKGQ
jgi:hypothetical protein